MRYIGCILSLFLVSIAHAEPRHRVIFDKNGSRMEIAIAQVNGRSAFTEAERTALLAVATTPVTNVDITPTEDEVNVSSNSPSFENYDDVTRLLRGNERVSRRKIRELREEEATFNEMGEQQKARRARRKYKWLAHNFREKK